MNHSSSDRVLQQLVEVITTARRRTLESGKDIKQLGESNSQNSLMEKVKEGINWKMTSTVVQSRLRDQKLNEIQRETSSLGSLSHVTAAPQQLKNKKFSSARRITP